MDQPNYDFILNPQKPQRSRLAMNSMKQRILVVGGAIGVLIVVIVLLSSIIGGLGSKSNEQFLDLAAYQSELGRVLELGAERARSTATKNKAVTASYTLNTDYQRTVTIINNRGVKPPKDLLARYKGGDSDQKLDAAEKANNFDSVYEEIYKEKLTNYRAKLNEIYPSLAPNEQAVLKDYSNHAKLLLGEKPE